MSSKVAIVTGANKGLGFSIVRVLCEKFDGTVYLTSRDQERGKQACKELKNIGLKPLYHQLDITNTESVKSFCEYIKNEHGNIDILINNAGILFLLDNDLPKEYQAIETMKVNFFATVEFTESIIPMLNKNGKIINIASSSGHLSRIPSEVLKNKIVDSVKSLEGLKELMKKYVDDVKNKREVAEGWGDSPYVVSKVAINGYTFNLDHRGITANSVHPGYVISDMTKGKGTISPQEAAILPVRLALDHDGSGKFYWQDGEVVPWDVGPDPRWYKDGREDLHPDRRKN